jgi:recombination protein RecA
MAKEKKKDQLSLEEALAKLNKDFGPGSVISGDEILECTEFVSTGSLGLDIAIGIGGIPSDGKIIDISGWESSGKSTLIQTICGNFQRKYPDKKVIYVDSEHSLDRNYSLKLGLNLKELIVIQMDEGAGEAAFNKVNTLVDTGMISLVVYDSYNAMQPKKIVDGELGDATMGVHARLMGQVIAQDNAACTKYGTNFIYVGQLREKIGVMFGDPTTTQGGNALKFYAHVRLEASRSTTHDNSTWSGVKGKSDKLGNLHKVNVKKNKVGPPFRSAEYDIIYGEGIDKYKEIIELAHEYNVAKKYGENFTYKGNKILITDFIENLKDSDELFQELREEILKVALAK